MDYTYGLITLLMPVFLFALTVVLVLSLRWFSYKERMALIARDLPLEETKSPTEKHKLFLAIGLTISLVGLALSLGLATFGLGPWLLAGLIPFFIGLAVVLASLILRPAKAKKDDEELQEQEEPEEAVIEMESALTEENNEEEQEDEIPF